MTEVQTGSYLSSAAATSHTVTFTTTPTAGNTVIVCVCSDGTITTPSGWTKFGGAINFTDVDIYYRQNVPSGMTNVVFAINASTTLLAWYVERDDVLTPSGADKVATNTTQSGTNIASGTTATTTSANEIAYAAFGWPWGNTGDNISSFSNSYTSRFSNHVTVGTTIYLGVASLLLSSTGAQSTTATVSTGGAGNPVGVIGTFILSGGGAPAPVNTKRGLRLYQNAVHRSTLL